MYYSYQKKLYTKDQLAGQTFDETDKPEPLFTLDEMIHTFTMGYGKAKQKKLLYSDTIANYFKDTFNITI